MHREGRWRSVEPPARHNTTKHTNNHDEGWCNEMSVMVVRQRWREVASVSCPKGTSIVRIHFYILIDEPSSLVLSKGRKQLSTFYLTTNHK